MEKSIADRHLIDRFLQGELSGIERESFNQRVREDEAFRNEVELHKVIYSGIVRANQDKLKGLILSSLNYRKPAVPFALKLIVTFLVVTGFGITLWFYVGNESANRDQAKSWFAFLKSKKSADNTASEITKPKTSSRSRVVSATDSLALEEDASRPVYDSVPEKIANDKTELDTLQPAITNEEIIVKQDQLLVGTTIVVEDKSEAGSDVKDDQLTNGVLSKLNPAADLPEEEKVSSDYQVEFWVSPINYRGYKMSKNKLILFGIDEPEAVKLYRVKDALYM
ncbi:MAG: hypothetical protein NTV09_10190, partial [Bacteroidetes bacterium]|nr:hypothetical protein [Bacteroidota bacterium]